MSLALVYLSRGADGGLTAAKAFFDAHNAFPPGCLHELIVITKGWSGVTGREEVENLARLNHARVINLPDDGFDWGAYMRLIPQLEHNCVCFLNTFSRPCKVGWLNLLRMALEIPGASVGAVGATASWQTLAPTQITPSLDTKYNTPLFYPIRLVRSVIRFFSNTWAFPPFPNPHLRSNALLMRRELFLDFAQSHKVPRSKRDALKLESGRAGFTVFLRKRGLEPLVAGADGGTYGPKYWINSGTFRAFGQHNLLVKDNQTTVYEVADHYQQAVLEMISWGRSIKSNQ